MKESYKSYITLHKYLREAIADLAKHIISLELCFGNLSEETNNFFMSHSPKEISQLMIDVTFKKHVEFSESEENEFVMILAKYILSNMSAIFNRTFSEVRYSSSK